MINDPKIPKGWHRLRAGALTKDGDRCFNFSYGRWVKMMYPGVVCDPSSNLMAPWYIRRNRKPKNKK